MVAFLCLNRGYDCDGVLCCGSNGICLCMFCVLPVNGLRLYCMYMICYRCGVYLIFLLYVYFIFIGVMLSMESAGDVVISAGKRNADVNVAISFFPRKVDVICIFVLVLSWL